MIDAVIISVTVDRSLLRSLRKHYRLFRDLSFALKYYCKKYTVVAADGYHAVTMTGIIKNAVAGMKYLCMVFKLYFHFA